MIPPDCNFRGDFIGRVDRKVAIADRRLRDLAPVRFMPGLNPHVITRYDLVREALRDTQTYSSRFDGFLGTAR